jgi:hypothetical protein
MSHFGNTHQDFKKKQKTILSFNIKFYKMEKIRKSESDKATALNYFTRGLTLSEIEKLTNIPKRTLEGYSMRENWKEQRDTAKQTERAKLFKEFRKETKEAKAV